MTDYFALLNEPRRPWAEPDSLKKKFLALSAKGHPDRVHNQGLAERQAAHAHYVELNAAYNCLREPRERLRHLLELERGAKPDQVQQVPNQLVTVFLEIGQRCKEADKFLDEKRKASSPVLKAQMFQTGAELTDRLMELQRKLNGWEERLLQELKIIDANWAQDGPGSAGREAGLQQLEKLYQWLSYQQRWSSQLQERIVQISF